MKYYRRSSKPLLALLLVFCLLASFFPGAHPSALAIESRVNSTPIPVETVDELKAAVDKLNRDGGGTITLKQGVYELYEPQDKGTVLLS